ncbi:ABC transporter substrate-binding protein [Acaryochloris thomasi]|nr:sugar ABC transporter substrate-binding protein [Acaryochloris thomasi]
MISPRPWKRFTLFALLGLMLSLLISCAPGPSSSESDDGRAEVEFWTMQLQPEYNDYFNEVIETFESENPELKIRWVDVPWSAMQTRILSAVSANKAPDVVNLNPDFASQLASQDAWLNLNDKISEEVRSQYLPNIWKATTLGDKSFGFPWYLTSRIAIYNEDLLEQAGVDKPPTTYAELAQVAKQVKEKTGKYAFFVTAVPEDSGELLESFVQMGVELLDDQGKAAFNSPEGKAAFQYWTDLYQQGLLPPEVITEGHRQAVQLYQSGQAAILTSSPQFLKSISTNAPDIAKVSVPAPQISGESGKTNVAAMNLLVPSGTDQPEAALKFAQFVTNPENQLTFAKAANVLPSTQSSLADPYFSEVPTDASALDKGRVISASQMETAEVLIPVVEDVKKLQKIIYTNLQEAMLDKKSVDQAVADAEKEWNQEVSG